MLTIPNIPLTKPLTIFEGPDGAGKSTLAQRYAAHVGATYVHLGPLPRLRKGLARIYVEAIMPALLGYQHVVLDRCWLSEEPYGEAYRGGSDRLGLVANRMLERLAMRCATVVIKCQPPWETVVGSFRGASRVEMLQNEAQLLQVYNHYQRMGSRTVLPLMPYDFTQPQCQQLFDNLDHLHAELAIYRTPPHPLCLRTTGRFDAGLLLVGEGFGEVKEHDPLYQGPFVSFSDDGCSRWITEQLAVNSINEDQLLWVNADQLLACDDKRLLRHLLKYPDRQVVAMGSIAQTAVSRLAKTLPHRAVEHPQMWRRFHAGQIYPLPAIIKELLDEQ